MAKRMRTEVYQGLWALVFVLLVGGLIYAVARLPLTWYALLFVWLAAVNVVALGFYGHDKTQARANRRRVSEVVLHGLVFLGGTFGAYLGMWLFRHKTVKPSFQLLFRLMAFLQVMLIVAAAYRIWMNSRA
jgi:uncharacterized membrane protein YsdA (DUF1294 family)